MVKHRPYDRRGSDAILRVALASEVLKDQNLYVKQWYSACKQEMQGSACEEVQDMAGKRHPREVIAAKLAKADEMVARGETQQEISRALGVSIMTYHRWKKDRGDVQPPQSVSNNDAPRRPVANPWRGGTIADLSLENDRLRRLVTDLLLEKMALQEQFQAHSETLKRSQS